MIGGGTYIGGDGVYSKRWDEGSDPPEFQYDDDHSGFYIVVNDSGPNCCVCGGRGQLLTYTNFHDDSYAPDLAVCKECLMKEFEKCGI